MREKTVALAISALAGLNLAALNLWAAPRVFTAEEPSRAAPAEPAAAETAEIREAIVAVKAPAPEEPAPEEPAPEEPAPAKREAEAAREPERELAARVEVAAAKVEAVEEPATAKKVSRWSLLFASGSEVIANAEERVLAEIAKEAAASDQPLFIVGSADPRGRERWNVTLSEKRARAVAQHLQRRGVAPERMHIEGIGEIAPDIPGEEGFQRARRVEVSLGRSP